MPIRVVIIDDHPLILKAVVDELSSQPDIQVVGTADHGSELQRLARETSPDVVILDLGMSNGPFEPVTAVQSFVKAYPHIKILILTGYDDELYVREIIDAGALGYVLKSDDLSMQLPKGVRTVHKGNCFYTPAVLAKLLSTDPSEVLNDQELGVLRLAADGLKNSGIAGALGVSEKRVRNILSSVYQKLNLGDGKEHNLRVLAIKRARELQLLPKE